MYVSTYVLCVRTFQKIEKDLLEGGGGGRGRRGICVCGDCEGIISWEDMGGSQRESLSKSFGKR